MMRPTQNKIKNVLYWFTTVGSTSRFLLSKFSRYESRSRSSSREIWKSDGRLPRGLGMFGWLNKRRVYSLTVVDDVFVEALLRLTPPIISDDALTRSG